VTGLRFCVSSFMLQVDTSWPSSQKSMHTTRQWAVGLALVIITAWGLLLRVYGGDVQSFWVDEATSVNAALGILEDGTPHLPSGVSYWRAPLHTYLISGAIGLASPDEFVARLPAMLFGAAMIPLVFLLGRHLGGTLVGLASAALVAFADIEIAWSRQARMYQELQFFTVLAVYAYLMVLQRPSRKWIAIAGLAVLGAATSHVLGLLVPMIIVLHLAIVRFSEVRSVRDLRFLIRRKYIFSLALVTCAVLAVEWTQGTVSRVLGSSSDFVRNYLDYLQTSLLMVSFLGSAGLVIRLRYQPREVLLLLLLISLPLYLVSFHGTLPAYRYIYFVIPFVFIGFPMALISLPQLLRLARYKWLGPSYIVAGLIVVFLGGGFTLVPRDYYYLESTSPQPDFKSAYAVVSAQMRPGDVIIDAWPTVGHLYLPSPPDYWPVFSIDGTMRDDCSVAGGAREVYGNTICLPSTHALREVVESNPRGWVVMDDIAWSRLPGASRSYIQRRLTRVPVVSLANSPVNVAVFRWAPE